MTLSNHQYDQVAAYVREELTGTSLRQFETELVTNVLLKKEVQLQKAIANAFQKDRILSLLKQAKIDNLVEDKDIDPDFQSIKNNLQQAKVQNNYRRVQIRRFIGAVAAACLLLTLWISPWQSNYNPEQALVNIRIMPNFHDNREKIQDVSSSGSLLLIPDLNRAEAIFKDNKEESYQILEKTARQNGIYKGDEFVSAPPVVTLYKGIFKAQEKQYIEAIKLLGPLTEKESSVQRPARWYLGNIYILTGEHNKARQQFRRIKKDFPKVPAHKEQIKGVRR